MSADGRRRILFASVHPPGRVPSQRFRFEQYVDFLREKGFEISGTSPDGSLAELIELRDHPYFLACQYHPEFQSKPNKPHPLFKGFVKAALAHKD